MKPSIILEHKREDIRKAVALHHAKNARVFRPELTGHDTDTSDLDLLSDIKPETTLMDIEAIGEIPQL